VKVQSVAGATVGGHVVIYAFSNIAVAVFNFALFAWYARVLQPADYGTMSLLVSVSALAGMLGMMGLNNAVQRFYFDESESAARQRVWSSGFLTSMALTTAIAALVVLSMAWPGAWEIFDNTTALLAIAAILPQAIVIWVQDYARLHFRAWTFFAIVVGQALLTGAIGAFLIMSAGWGVRGFFAATLMGASATAVVALLSLKIVPRLAGSRTDITRLLRYGAPLVPAGLFIWASSAVTRWQLLHFSSLDAAGIFDVAWKLSAPVWILNVAVGQAFGPYAFKLRAEVPEYRIRLIETLHLIGVVTMVATCAVILFMPELCRLVMPPAYAGAALPCGVLAFGFYFSALHQVTALGISFAQRSHLIAVAWGGAAVLTFLLGFVLIPRFGPIGGAWCVALAYPALNGFYLFWTQRLHPLPFRVAPLVAQTAVGLLTLGFISGVQNVPLGLALTGFKCAWFGLMLAVLLRWGGAEKEKMRAGWKQILTRLRPAA
jgi:O-antigen/teichoic acid export membrane protein